MVSGTDERRFAVLRAIVADYVSTQEPVGSKSLVDKHRLGVSSATVRNDMAVLEAEGYITQPHTSSGRVPTDKGYRRFVDNLARVKPLSAAERRAIVGFLDGAVDLDDVLRRAVRLLAQLTRQVAVVQYPTLNVSTVRHLELVQLTPARVLAVLITDAGRVDQRVIEFGDVVGDDEMTTLRDLFSAALLGRKLPDATTAVADLVDSAPAHLSEPVLRTASVLLETLVEDPPERLLLGGTANLAGAHDFGAEAGNTGSLRSVLEALEEQVVVLKLLDAASESGRVLVRIGEETESEQIRGTSVVSTAYGTVDTVLGGMGVLGPTRMDYPSTMAAVAAVARYVGDILADG